MICVSPAVHHHSLFFTRRTTLLGVTFAAFCVAFLTIRNRSEDVSEPQATSASARPAVFQTRPRKTDVKAQAAPFELASASQAPAQAVSELEPAQNAELSRAIELNMMADRAGLKISSDQLSQLSQITAYFQEVRNAYEASIARKRSPISGRRVLLEIPLYPTAGDSMRELYYAEIEKRLGGEIAGEIRGKLGSQLENLFAGFGSSEQTLELNEAFVAEVALTRSAVFWKDTWSSGVVTHREETHFLSVEDPDLNEWGAFLPLFSGISANRG